MQAILPISIAMTLLTAGMATAQTMYRCGSNYQDRPCGAGQKEKAIGQATGPAAATGAAVQGGTNADCRQRGQDSLIFVYAWEGGATLDKQLEDINRKNIAESQKAGNRKLVTDVYRQRGTAAAVRTRIEAECMKELEDRARAAALADALMKSGARPPGAATTPAPAPASVRPPPGQSQADAKQQRCDGIDAQLRRNGSQQRAGGSISMLETLRNEQRELETQRRETAC